MLWQNPNNRPKGYEIRLLLNPRISGLAGKFGNPAAKFMPVPDVKASSFSRDDFVEIVRKLIATKKEYGSRAPEAAEKIIEFYETQKHYSKNFYLQIYIQLFSDLNFNIPQMREALQKAEAGHEVYFYVYDYTPEVLKHELLEGAGHGTEFSNFFGNSMGIFPDPPKNDTVVAKVTEAFIDLFVNFVKTG